MHSEQLGKPLRWAAPPTPLPEGFHDSPVLLIQLSLVLILKGELLRLLVVVHLPQQDDRICVASDSGKTSHASGRLLHCRAFSTLNPIYNVQ